jgi:hypothetical protein
MYSIPVGTAIAVAAALLAVAGVFIVFILSSQKKYQARLDLLRYESCATASRSWFGGGRHPYRCLWRRIRTLRLLYRHRSQQCTDPDAWRCRSLYMLWPRISHRLQNAT